MMIEADAMCTKKKFSRSTTSGDVFSKFLFFFKIFKVNKFSLTTWTVDAKMFGGFCDRKTISLKRRHVAAFFFAMNEPARTAAVSRN